MTHWTQNDKVGWANSGNFYFAVPVLHNTFFARSAHSEHFMSDNEQNISFQKLLNEFRQNLGKIEREFDCTTFPENSHLTNFFIRNSIRNIRSSPEICVPYYMWEHI